MLAPRIWIPLLSLSFCAIVRGEDLQFVDAQGSIERVTLYREQALITRKIEVPAGNALRVIKVSNLPEMILSDSAFAEGNETTEVRAVRVSTKVVAESEREDVRKLTSSKNEVHQQITTIEAQKQVAHANLQHLERVMSFSIGASTKDLERGVLNDEVLMALTDYSFKTREKLANELLTLETKTAELQEQLSRIDRELHLISQSSGKDTLEANIVVSTKEGAAGFVRFSYLVNGCGWSPQYTIRGSWGKADFNVRYSAMVQQMSGEKWDEVKLVVSTASPSVSASGPSLTPFRVTSMAPGGNLPSNAIPQQMAGPGGSAYGNAEQLQQQAQGLRKRRSEVEQSYQVKGLSDAPMQRDLALNGIAVELQNLELLAHSKQAKSLAEDAQEDVASQTYVIEQPVSLDSRREQQLVQITETVLQGELYHIATPLLSSYAYREADLVNASSIGLLGGPATIYLDERFVGRTALPSTASGQHLIIGFGADQQVRTRRELVDKNDETQGGNRRLNFNYRLVVSNFKSAPVTIRLMDRLPIPQNPNDISVKLEDPKHAVSEDPLYRRVQFPRGILRWDLEVPALSHGSKAFDVDYHYTVEFDRNRSLTAVGESEQIMNDYMEMAAPAGAAGPTP